MVVRFLRNVFSNYALNAVTTLSSFILTPLLFRYLGPEDYAIFAFGLALAAALEALDVGMLNALIRFVSILAARQAYEELAQLVSSVFFLLLGIGLFAALAIALLSARLGSFFHLTGPNPAIVPVVLILIGITPVFQLPATALTGHLMGSQDFHLSNAVEITTQIFRFAAILLLMREGYGLPAIIAVVSAVAFFRLLGMLIAASKASIPFVPRWSASSLRSLKGIWEFTSLSFIEDTGTKWYLQLDSFLAARLLPLRDLAVLNVARRFPAALMQLISQPMGVAYPLVSSVVAKGDRAAMEKFMIVSTRLTLAIELPLGAAMFVWAGTILRLWVGPGVDTGVGVFQILVLFAVAASLQEAPLTLLYGLGKIRLSTVLSLVMLAGAAALAIPACAHWGLTGLAIVYALTFSLGTLILQGQSLVLAGLLPGWADLTNGRLRWRDPRLAGMRRWLRHSVLLPLLAEIPTVGWLLLSYAWLPHTWAGLVGAVAATVLLYIWLLHSLFPRREGETWKARLRKMIMEVE